MRIIIIGAGIGGLTAAIALQQKGLDIIVYEMAAAIKPVGAGVGLAANALEGFRRLGIADAIIAKGKLLKALRMLDEKGKIISDQNAHLLANVHFHENLVIHRAALHQVLLEQLEPGVVRLGKRCTEVQQIGQQVKVFFEDGTWDEADLLIGADGIHSPIRRQFVPKSKPRYAGYTCWRAVIDDPGLNYDRAVSAETWARKGRVGMVALPENRIYWYCCINASENDRQMRDMPPAKLAEWFKDVHPPIAAMLAATQPAQMIRNDIADLEPLKKFVFGRTILLGDAAHATTPNMGQGACQAIEDAVVLADCLTEGVDLDQALASYERRRLKRTARIIRLSRRLGKVAQSEHPVAVRFRNLLFRMLPKRFVKAQMEWLFHVDF